MSLTGFLWLAGFALFFVGERLYGGGDEVWRWVLDGAGLALALGGLGLLLSRQGRMSEDQRGPFRLALIYALVALSSLLLYLLLSDTVGEALALEAEAQERFEVAVSALIPILWLAGTLPLLSIARAVALSPVRIIPSLVREGAISALAVAFALSMLFPLNYLGTQTNERWDLGYFKTAVAGSRTQAMVDGLEEPVRVVAFFPTGSDVADEVKAYFEPLQGPMLPVEHVDHALEPGLAEELKVRDNGYVVFVKGEQVERVKIGADFDGAKRKLKDMDQEMQTALVKLARGQKVAYFTVGHGEMYWKSGDDKAIKISTLKEVLTGLNYKVKELGLAEGLGDRVPDDADVVFVMGPKDPFLAEEIAALDSYRQQGGALLLSLEPGGTDLSGLLSPLGLKVDLGATLASDNYYLKVTGGPGDRVNQVTNKFSTHPSVTTLSRTSKQVAVTFPGAVAIEQIEGGPAAAAGVKVQETVRSLAATWQDRDGNLELNEPAEARKQYNLAMAVSGPAVGGAAPVVEALAPDPAADPAADPALDSAKDPAKEEAKKPEPKPDPRTEYRVVVMGDSNWASDLFLLYSGNGQLAVDALGWLTEDEALQGEVSSEEDVKIQHTKEGQGLWFYGSAIFVPFGLLGVGLARLALRKRRGRT